MTTIVWLPLNRIISPALSRTATPRRSESGSVPINISAPTALAKSVAILSAGFSSGFGDLTVGKLPSGVACSCTMWTSLYPACASV